MIDYRDATPIDAEALSAVFRRTFTDTFGPLYAPEDLAAFLATKGLDRYALEIGDPDFAFRIAEEDRRAVGFAKLGPATLPCKTPAATLELHQLYILKAWQGRGVAAALMDWVLAESRRRGATHLQLSVYVDNHRARRFYERYGFEEVGSYEFMVGDHVDDDRVMRIAL